MTIPAEALRQIYSRYVGALQGASDFLKDDLPSASPGLSKWVQETGRRACRNYARDRGSVPFLTSDPSWDGICSGYWDTINEGPTSGGSYAPPFDGGQCSILYKVFFTAQQIRKADGVITATQSDFSVFNGPILGAIACEGTSCNIPGLPTSAYATWIISGSLSDSGEIGGGQKIIIGNKRYIAQGFSGSNSALTSTLEITSVSPNNSSQSDNCGSLPPEYRPPTFPPNLPPLPPPTNPAPGLGNNWEVNILPDGQVNICIGGDCSIGFPPDGGGGPDSGGGPGEPDGDPQENDPSDPNDPGEITGCVENGNLLTGLKIEITQTPINSSGSNGINYRVAWIFMGPDSDKLDLVSDGRTLEDGQFVIPDSTDCTCYKVRINLGWGLRVQAFSRPKEE